MLSNGETMSAFSVSKNPQETKAKTAAREVDEEEEEARKNL